MENVRNLVATKKVVYQLGFEVICLNLSTYNHKLARMLPAAALSDLQYGTPWPQTGLIHYHS